MRSADEEGLRESIWGRVYQDGLMLTGSLQEGLSNDGVVKS